MPSGSFRHTLSDATTIPGSGTPPPSLLVVDDDSQMLQTLVQYFEMSGFDVAKGASVGEAKIAFYRRRHWSLIISDYHLPDGTGWDFCCWVRAQPVVTPPFLFLSGGIGAETLSGVSFLAKPFQLAQLEARVRALLRPSGV